MQHLDGRTDAKAKVQEPRSNPHDVAGDGETGESWTASGDFYGIFYQFSMKPIFGQLPNAFSLWREHHVGEKITRHLRACGPLNRGVPPQK